VIIKHEASDIGRKIAESIKKLKDASVKVGWFANAEYLEADGSSEPVAAVAAQNEYGNPARSIPARPFMRPTIVAKQNEWKATAENGARKVLKGELTINDSLDLLGFQAEGDIKKTIKSLYSPALAESTILNRIERNKRLGSTSGRLSEKSIGNITKPLVDTGHMIGTLTHEVSE
jgi:hypothetical protein